MQDRPHGDFAVRVALPGDGEGSEQGFGVVGGHALNTRIFAELTPVDTLYSV